ncbi:PAS domain S-box protein [Haloarcula halobia]|uniref:PAS domain S-box protein n=1 Tax=Haloarcula halobia TaxID=3033388 RepID=UPI0023ECCF08|nr:PAS domain S-box protein [Halomicroarcula sp. XH51]
MGYLQSIPATTSEDLLKLVDVMVVVLDVDGRVTLTNQKAREILGYEEGELVGRDWFETCVPKPNRTDVAEVFDQLMAGEVEPAERLENPVITKNGEERIIEWHNTVLRDDEGEISGTLSSGLDVTTRRENEQRLREEREKYSTLVENSNDGIAIIQDGTFKFVNERFAALHETTREDLIGDSVRTHVDPEYHDLIQKRYEQRVAGEDPPTRYEIEILDGKRTLEINTASIEYEGTPADMGIVRDVTEQNRRERELERSRQRYQTLVDRFPNGLVTLFDEDYRYQVVGGRGFDELERSVDDLEGRCLEEAFSSEAVDILKPLYQQALDGESNTVEVTFQDRVFKSHVAPVRDDEGSVFAGMSLSQDITEQKQRERDLETARQRYRTLLKAAPDPVFVADVDTGEIIEANRAAAEFRGQPHEEIIDLHQTDLHPSDEVDRYRDLFETAIEEGERKRRLSNGDPIYAVTADGDRVPVEISVETIELDEETVIYGVFRDISEQLAYERALTGLHETTPTLFEAETRSAVCQQVVETVTDVLDLDGATVYLIDERDGVLRPVAHASSSDQADTIDPPVFEPGESIAWRVFTQGEPEVFENVRIDDDVYNPETVFRSEIIVPLGEQGVLIVGDTRPDAFDRQSVELVEILCATAEAALDSADREKQLKTHEQHLQQQTEQLEQVESINSQIRDVARAIIQSDTREEIEETVCTHLVESAPITFAWIGERDLITETLTPRVTAGDHRGYLDDFSRSLADDAASEPAVETARTGERRVIDNTATDITRYDWRSSAVQHGFQSVLSVPLTYQDTIRGVLTVYSSNRAAFTGMMEPVLSELGELIAHAIEATERKQSLLSNQVTELEFDIQDRACFFLRFAQRTNSSLEVERIVPQTDDSSLLFVRIVDGPVEQLLEEGKQSAEVRSVRLIETESDALIQLRIEKPFIASRLADHGLIVQNISAGSSECRVTVAVPPTFSINQVIDTISSVYDDTEVLAKRSQRQYSESPGEFADQVLEKLTPRQREVAEMAYLRGACHRIHLIASHSPVRFLGRSW